MSGGHAASGHGSSGHGAGSHGDGGHGGGGHGDGGHGHAAGHAATDAHGPAEIPAAPETRWISPARADFEQPWPGRLVLWPFVWLVVAVGFYVAARAWTGPVELASAHGHAGGHGGDHDHAEPHGDPHGAGAPHEPPAPPAGSGAPAGGEHR